MDYSDYSDNDSDVGMSFSDASTAPPSPRSANSELESEGDSVSMRSGSPSSLLSISSSVKRRSYRHAHGRTMNSSSDVYSYPADEEEIDRLHKQHLFLIEATGEKYSPPIYEVMTSALVDGKPKACLDLGCGSGSWIIDFARDFPESEAVGVDLVPTLQENSSIPDNCWSEVDDLNYGMEHFYDRFDIAHGRFIVSGIKDYRALIDEMSRVLRPRGVLDICETDYCVYDINYQKIVVSPHELGPPWYARFLTFASEAATALGSSTAAIHKIYDWLSEHPGFEEVQYREYWFPVSPWMDKDRDPFNYKIGGAVRDDILEFLGAVRVLFLRRGHREEVVDELINNTRYELLQAKLPCYVRMLSINGRRKADYNPRRRQVPT
ncbi:S-adenosyl-L-methionine-dependent methyltransferase [Coprinopsis marcescibilis]|uniref:S-adenosyl-L-methionine-dependent methyltransferase n=1 Tax=Coprinopsis marcescibilis TaxID=230819 RepID=A0A5C3L285_COPMA|nr:S-adenosyl-L-methionine-dependent methyltransferase [Coprinopsis marcescibilis]